MMRCWRSPSGFVEATELLGTVRRFSKFCEANRPETIANGTMKNEAASVS